MAEGDAKDIVSRIIERRDEFAKWFDENYGHEFEEVWRNAKCRTKPIMTKDANGKTVEDKTRTNVCMPDTAVIIHRRTARLTAQPPHINYRALDQDLAQRLTAWSYQQYDKTGEAKVARKHVRQESTFGFSYTKLWWDKIMAKKQFRFDREKVYDQLPKSLASMGYDGAAIDKQMADFGKKPGGLELAQQIAENGPEMTKQFDLTRYEGPRSKFCFIGDIYLEPGAMSLDESTHVIEQFTENDLWIQDLLNQTYVDPDTEEELPICGEDSQYKELLESQSSNINSRTDNDLRTRLRNAAGISDPHTFANLRLIPGKRFLITEQHIWEDGRQWIYWIGNERFYIGKMPYKWDFDGRWLYSEYVSMPDLLWAQGDSTSRLGRFLQKMHNVSVAQRKDLVTAVTRPLVFEVPGANIPDEHRETGLLRVIKVQKGKEPVVNRLGDVPPGAFEQEAQEMSMWRLLAPEIGGVESVGTSFNPTSGKTATTAVLQQRAQDVLTQSAIDAYDLYQKDVGEKKLAMLQYSSTEPIRVEGRYFKTDYLKEHYGQTGYAVIDPLDDLQQDIGVEPEAGSTLAIDDEFKAMRAQQLYTLAAQDPITFNKYECARFLVSTIRGADVNKIVNTPTPPPPEPPKQAVSLSIKFETLPAQTQNAIIQRLGLPADPDIENKAKLESIVQLSQAADAADNLDKPAESEMPVGTQPQGQGSTRQTLAGRG